MNWFLDQLIESLLAATTQTLNGLWRLLAATAFFTPDVTAFPQVAALNARSLLVVNVGYVLAVLAAAVVVMANGSMQVRYGVGELAPRLVLGFVAANFSAPICRAFTQGANALVRALTGEGIASEQALTQLLRTIIGALANPINGLLAVVVGVVLDVLLIMLLVTWIARILTLIVLGGIAPVALACHGLPFTDPAARLWWRAMSGCVAVVVLQAVALHTSLAVFLDPAANVRAFPGVPQDLTGTVNLLVVACLLWVTVRIPALVRRYVTSTPGRANLAGAIVRLVIVQQLTSGLRHVLRGRSLPRATGRRGDNPPLDQVVIPYWRPRAGRAGTTAARAATSRVGGSGSGAGGNRSQVPPGVTPLTVFGHRRGPGAPPVPRGEPAGTGWPTGPSRVTTSGRVTKAGVGWPTDPPHSPRYPYSTRIPPRLGGPARHQPTAAPRWPGGPSSTGSAGGGGRG
jgi:hypothetical protein